ncbi:MAG TPA: histidine phosphatase family protein [Thermoflexia bacterium]|nr:histidine phosphatase family protein [Thermoflexia bacterium]
MSLRLWLVRHAESTWNAAGRIQGQADPPLSAQGRVQARSVALRLGAVEFQALYASPLQRAEQTAQAIAETTGLEVLLDTRLQEQGVGEASGLNWDGILVRWPQLKELSLRGESLMPHIPGAERMPDFEARVGAVFGEVRAKYQEGDVALVSHGGVFHTYLRKLMHVEDGYHSGLSFGNTSLSQVEFAADGHVSIKFVNDRHHLRDGYSKV